MQHDNTVIIAVPLKQKLINRFKAISPRLRWATLSLLLLAGVVMANYPALRQQIKIAGYLFHAEKALAAKQLLEPAENNADYFYHQVLLLDPDNSFAQKGLVRVTVARVTQALELGEKNLADNHLLKPKGDNAVFYFRQALKLAPDASPAQAQARDGLHRIANIYLAMSKDAFAKGDNSTGLKNIASGLKAEPHHTELLALREEHKPAHSGNDEPAKNPFKQLWEKVKSL